MLKPDFFMTSREGYLPATYKCFSIKRMRLVSRDDLLLIRIEPSLSGSLFNLTAGEFDRILIASRLRGSTLFPITKWPTSVYVLAPLIDEIEEKEELREHECRLIAWAKIYQTPLAAITQ